MFYKMYFWMIEMSWIRGPFCGPIRGRIRGPICGYLHSGCNSDRCRCVIWHQANIHHSLFSLPLINTSKFKNSLYAMHTFVIMPTCMLWVKHPFFTKQSLRRLYQMDTSGYHAKYTKDAILVIHVHVWWITMYSNSYSNNDLDSSGVVLNGSQ